jgi:hypothetical protein
VPGGRGRGDFLPGLMVGVGAEGARARPRGVHDMATGPGANENSVVHSEFGFSEFLPTGCSTKCPHEFQIRIFENFHCGLSSYWTRILEIFLF